jgi:hypothetical protein
MPRKKVAKKAPEKEVCESNNDCTCRWGMLKISVIAFTLFIVTVWPAVGNWLVNRVPWWVYLIIFVVFGAASMGMKNKCWCCRK